MKIRRTYFRFRLLSAQATSRNPGSDRAAGETVRIWYSDQPDEMSGLYWFAAQLECWEVPADRVVLVKLEPWVLQEDRVAGYREWGEVEPGEWGKHLSSRKTVSQAFPTGISRRWKELQGEHAVLRAVVDGRLCSVPEDFYDPWIRKAADEQEDEVAFLFSVYYNEKQCGLRVPKGRIETLPAF